MKKRILLSMILLALCLIQASADTYYFKILLTNENGQPGEWSEYIKVDAVPDGVDVNGQPKYKYPNGLGTLLNGGTVKDNENPEHSYTLPKKADNNEEVNLDRIYGIEFANGKGRYNNAQENIMEGNDYEAWKKIRSRIKYLRLRYYIRDTYNDNSYLADMFNVEELELPKDGMKVGNEDNDGQYYFASAHNLKKITIWNGAKAVDITDNTDDVVKKKKLLNIVGKYMFANCWNLSPKYINRLIEGVTEIKNNAFFVNDNDRDKPSDKTKMAIEIPSSVTKIGDQAFLNRLKDTGLNILGNGSLDIGIEAFKACDELAKIQTLDNRVLRISKNAFMLCKQLNAFENINNAKITSLGEGVFRDCQSMTSKFVNDVLQNYANNGGTEIPVYLFSGCNGDDGHSSFTQLDIPASFTQIDKGAFANNPDVTKIIVHRGEQINAQSYGGEDGIFYNMVPNKVQVVFEGKADNNYKVYRENIKVGGEDKGPNAFMDLLTKTLNENDDDYQVVAQRHADVRLTRTFKAGWNTLVLPFGARHGEGREDGAGDCSRIFQKALNLSNKPEGFMIAAYRGLAKNEAQSDNSTFYFLKYASYDTDPIDEFEPLLIRMTQEDIAADGVYTFKDVELNFDGDFKDPNNDKIKIYKEYTAAEAKERMGKREYGQYFDGNYNHEANDKFKKCTYDDFYFTGTLYKQQCTAENSAFIAPGDYIIQNNTFVKCLAGRKYGLKGFRGYFKQQPSSTPSAKGNIGISLVDRNGVVSSIHQVDGASLTSASVAPAAVYNLSGQQVGNSLSTLAKGVYIVNGKKFVKK
nr:leucine-rich repeat domain-containing protein [Prevotella sp.]